MDIVEQRFKQTVSECLPALTEVYLLRTRVECAAHLYEVGGLTKRSFAEELDKIRNQLIKLEEG